MGIFSSKQNNNEYTQIMKWVDLPKNEIFFIIGEIIIRRFHEDEYTILEIENLKGDRSRVLCDVQLAIMLDNFCYETRDEGTFCLQTLDHGDFKLTLRLLDMESNRPRPGCGICMKSYIRTEGEEDEVYLNFNFKASKHEPERTERSFRMVEHMERNRKRQEILDLIN